MSDCGFCVGGNYDNDDGDAYFGSKLVRSKTDRRCEECGRTVPKKTPIVYHRGKGDGRMWQYYCCPVCDEIAKAFCCNGRMFGNFWSDMEDMWSALTTACYERLSTVQAKVELQRRWIEWNHSSWRQRKARERVNAMVVRARKEIPCRG